ncbi:MAG: bifunctional indole-3-glycerol-phosphate synthase TrpC/phosphoribosylanthranilate isomerase TrpF [Candidatus Gracilibacteria bacterium]|nr:bifunctional indole-3-glycerol-phosphate synthase TrpC/phosphoribosylanthranilate isomerase TrpF [Candidatus Gracilibacteria bacterium]
MYKELISQLTNKKSLKNENIHEFLRKSSDGKLSQVEQAAVLIALQTKGVSSSELKSFVSFLQKHMQGEIAFPGAIDICGTGGSGLARINTSTISAFILSALGVSVAKHGNKAASGRFGSFDLLEKLGVKLDQDAETIERIAEQTQLAFLYARSFHPVMKHFAPVRKALGTPTVFNIIGPLLNPAGTKKQIIGTTFEDQMELIAETCKKLGRSQVMVVCGEDGLDEVTLTGKTKVVELVNGTIKKYILSPKSFGISSCEFKEISGGNAKMNTKIARDIIAGTCKTRHLDLVLMNTALALKLSGTQKNLKKGYNIAKEAVLSGAVNSHFQNFLHADHAPSILLRIKATKKKEVERRKKKLSLKKIQKSLKPSRRDFRNALVRHGLSLIAEVKQASPSAGMIKKEGFSPKKIAKMYEANGARAISVLTDKTFFGGELKYLADVKEATSLTPLLCKDFIIDEYQIFEARRYGADAILLIAALLNTQEMEHFLQIAKSLQMDVLCEVHNEEELSQVLQTSAEIIGVNNRNLHDFTIDLMTTHKLSKKIPQGKIIVSESGISSKAHVKKLPPKVDAILVGTSLMKSKNIGEKIKQLVGKNQPLIKICGVQSIREAQLCQKLDVDFIGLNMVSTSDRQVSYQMAQNICDQIKKNPKSPTRVVGVFQDQTVEEINKASIMIHFDFVQLSGKENTSFIRKINKPLIKGVSIHSEKDIKRAQKLIKVSDYILFDGKTPGSGQAFNHGLARGFKHPFLLAGGITPSNVKAFIQLVQPLGVDIASGVESKGKRDLKKIEKLCQQVRS